MLHVQVRMDNASQFLMFLLNFLTLEMFFKFKSQLSEALSAPTLFQ